MNSFVVFKEHLLIAVPKDHPINEKAVWEEGKVLPSLDLFWLNGEKLILAKQNQSIRRDSERILNKNGVRPGKIREICSIETAMQMVGEGLGIGFNRESYVMYMKKQENVRYYCMRNIDSATDFVLAYRKEMPVTGYMQRMIDMLMAHGRECEKIFPQVIRQHGCQNAF